MSGSMWGGDRLDLDAYLARIGYEGEARPGLATLRALHRGHVAAFPFENLDIVLGRPVRLDVGALQAKMVRQRRGGYCYEQNLLFAAVLERLGFAFTGLGGRIRMGSSTAPRAITHMLLKVDLGVGGTEPGGGAACGPDGSGGTWLADVGFGGGGLLEPVPLRDGATRRQGEWTFGVAAEPRGVWALRTRRPEGWFDLYGFTLEERVPADYAVMHHYNATHPRSAFTGRPVVQRTEPSGRRALAGGRLSVARTGAPDVERAVPAGAFGAVLREEFGIEVSAEDAAELGKRYGSGA
ncbi:arylamine N-acetyltransferase [Streptomyces sp. B1866]|uniref:arylamine N-acetyltransferase family protein n=1 Tax=Streptomyces sp. B1866 TaxID=3075431 RepID=UPI00288F2980|nr:arylamine N-acetyltransferase [Streptomyces sp. B1866]MDT3397317.1 arylamine N-acetyltransferase [Streptomyces sp. B1866]